MVWQANDSPRRQEPPEVDSRRWAPSRATVEYLGLGRPGELPEPRITGRRQSPPCRLSQLGGSPPSLSPGGSATVSPRCLLVGCLACAAVRQVRDAGRIDPCSIAVTPRKLSHRLSGVLPHGPDAGPQVIAFQLLPICVTAGVLQVVGIVVCQRFLVVETVGGPG